MKRTISITALAMALFAVVLNLPAPVGGGGAVIISPGGGSGSANTNNVTMTGRTIIRTNLLVDGTGSVTATPVEEIQVIQNGGGAYIELDTYRTSANAGGIVIGHARGTYASPTVLQANDTIGQLFFVPYSGEFATLSGQNGYSAGIVSSSTATPTPTSLPGGLFFQTTETNAIAPTPRFYITPDGRIGINKGAIDVGAMMQAAQGRLDVTGDIRASGNGVVNGTNMIESVTATGLKSVENGTNGITYFGSNIVVKAGGASITGNISQPSGSASLANGSFSSADSAAGAAVVFDTYSFGWGSGGGARSRMYSPANGRIRVVNADDTAGSSMEALSLIGTNGIATYSTTATNAIAATGITNTSTFNRTAMLNATAVAYQIKNHDATIIYNSGTVTVLGLPIPLQPGGAITAASGLAGTLLPY